MRPIVEITIDGNPVSGAFYERLISVSIVDKEGVASDTIDIELNDGSPQFLTIPRKGAVIDARLGYGAARSLGSFTVDKVTVKCFPFSMSISGKAADLRSGKLKERQERHWDDKTLKEILDEIASESGLSAAVDPEIGAFKYPWLGQQDESNIHFIRRLEKRHNALATIKNGRLIFAKRGSGMSASGQFAGSIIVTPSIMVEGSCSFEANDRTKYKKVVAYYQDRNKAERVEIEADADADGDSVYRMPEPYASVEEADEAADAKAKELKRGEGAASVTVIGDTSICAGAALLFKGVRAGLDGVPYVIDTATHTYNKSGGYQTQISAKLYDGKSGNSSSGSGDDVSDGEAETSKDTVAKDAPAGTPATPSDWSIYQRNGHTDAN